MTQPQTQPASDSSYALNTEETVHAEQERCPDCGPTVIDALAAIGDVLDGNFPKEEQRRILRATWIVLGLDQPDAKPGKVMQHPLDRLVDNIMRNPITQDFIARSVTGDVKVEHIPGAIGTTMRREPLRRY